MGEPSQKMMKLGEKGKHEKLRKYTEDRRAEVRADAYEALGLVDTEEASHILTSGIRDESPAVRAAVARSLKKIGRKGVVEMLKHQAGKETDPAIATAMREAVAAINLRQ